MWVICGDLNATAGSLSKWKSEFEKDDDPEAACITIHYDAHERLSDNRPDDYMLSRGFSTAHVESTMGCYQKTRKRCTDNHDIHTLRGHKATRLR